MSQSILNSPSWLLQYSRNEYSQAGEDGIVEKILDTLPESDQWCVEFGAWDGIHLSNSRNLIINRNYSAILIEGDPKKFDILCENYQSNKNVTAFNSLVGFSESNNLDSLLSKTDIPENFDFLSIDIDGNDYHVWKAISTYHPKVICIEFNQTIPTEVRFVQPSDPKINQGSSLLSLVELGKEKGYELVCVSSWNAFFVKENYLPLFGISDNSPQCLRQDLDGITYIFSGYDGTVFVQGKSALPWHNIPITSSRLQQLPKVLRKFPSDYNIFEKLLFKLLKLIRRL